MTPAEASVLLRKGMRLGVSRPSIAGAQRTAEGGAFRPLELASLGFYGIEAAKPKGNRRQRRGAKCAK